MNISPTSPSPLYTHFQKTQQIWQWKRWPLWMGIHHCFPSHHCHVWILISVLCTWKNAIRDFRIFCAFVRFFFPKDAFIFLRFFSAHLFWHNFCMVYQIFQTFSPFFENFCFFETDIFLMVSYNYFFGKLLCSHDFCALSLKVKRFCAFFFNDCSECAFLW